MIQHVPSFSLFVGGVVDMTDVHGRAFLFQIASVFVTPSGDIWVEAAENAELENGAWKITEPVIMSVRVGNAGWDRECREYRLQLSNPDSREKAFFTRKENGQPIALKKYLSEY